MGKTVIIDGTFTLGQTLGGIIWLLNSNLLPIPSSLYTINPSGTVYTDTTSNNQYGGVVKAQNGGIVLNARNASKYYFHLEYIVD